MLKEKDIRKAKKIAKGFFKRIDSSIDVDTEKGRDKNIEINVRMDEPQVLIGEGGKTLKGVERLLRLALRNNIDEKFYVNLDINGYKRKKKKYLEERAQEVANEVSLTGVKKKMPALPASERRIIHMELEKRKDVTTESVGREPERQVVVKPSSDQ